MTDCPLCLGSDSRHFFEHYWKCPRCSLIFLDPKMRLSPEQEKSRYDEHNNSPESTGYRNFLAQLAEPLMTKLAPASKGLDFGCGPGPTLSHLFIEQGHTVENYDPYYFPEKNLLEQQYDFVTCTEVLEHLYSPNAIMAQLTSLLCPGSYGGIMTEILQDERDFPTWWYHRDPTHVCFYQRETLEWIASWQAWRVEILSHNVIIFQKN